MATTYHDRKNFYTTVPQMLRVKLVIGEPDDSEVLPSAMTARTNGVDTPSGQGLPVVPRPVYTPVKP